jgi:LAO/AO transport system kinase
MWQQLLNDLQDKDTRALARAISLVENELPGFEQLMQGLPANEHAILIGITGAPGAGKSTLTDALIGEFVNEGNRVAVLCVDPSSPFNLGALLGDRIRMSRWYTNESVFIRSLATRGSMGGLNPKIIEIADLVRAAHFDYIIVETVGVGQSEIEIAGLADTTIVVVVPEAGDEIQTMKAGLMEIADIFVLNKSDRPDADLFVKNLRQMLAPAFHLHRQQIPIIKTVANNNTGITELYKAIKKHYKESKFNERKLWLLAEKAYFLIQQSKMKDIRKEDLLKQMKKHMESNDFNMYRFIRQYI